MEASVAHHFRFPSRPAAAAEGARGGVRLWFDYSVSGGRVRGRVAALTLEEVREEVNRWRRRRRSVVVESALAAEYSVELWGMALGLGPASLGRHFECARGRRCLIQPPGRSRDDDMMHLFG